MIRLEPINGKNVWEILELHVGESQQHFVSDNRRSIIEAYLCLSAGGHVYPFGIYDDEIPVGFAMVGYGTDEDWENPPTVAKDTYNIWRFMIDERHQRKGYGKQALKQILDFISTMPCGEAERCWLSYEPENTAARDLYAEFGFSETGEMDADEVIAVRPITKNPSPQGESW